MNDDWRLQIDIHDPRHVTPLLERLDARELEHDLSNAFHDRLVVSRDGDRVFVYGGTREVKRFAPDCPKGFLLRRRSRRTPKLG